MSREQRSYFWLDGAIHKQSNMRTATLIRQMTRKRLMTFSTPKACLQYLTGLPITKKVALIVSNSLGEEFLPSIHDLPQIETIYIYCSNKWYAEQWSCKYGKVKNIFAKQRDLLEEISKDIKGDEENTEIPMSIFSLADKELSLFDLTNESIRFLWHQLILTALRFTAGYGNSKGDMVAEARAHYHNDATEMRKIRNFEEKYDLKTPFDWYSLDCFVYRLLNKSLRTQNIEIIYKFRFFIDDLHREIKRHYLSYIDRHSTNPVHHLTVYRGQRLSMAELKLLRDNVNNLVASNSFLSTGLSRELAEIFAETSHGNDSTSALQSVIFIIDIYDVTKEMTPFAFLSLSDYVGDENEVLFSIGAIFKIESVIQYDNMWNVRLRLSQEENNVFQKLFKDLMKQITSETGPSALGWFLYKINEFEKAKHFIELILNELSSNKKEIANAFNLLGLLHHETEEYDKAAECYKNALDMYNDNVDANSAQVVNTYYNYGLTCLCNKDIEGAKSRYNFAQRILMTSPHKGQPIFTFMMNTLKAKIEIELGDCHSALAVLKSTLEQKELVLGKSHLSVASTHHNIGLVLEKMKNFVGALQHFEEALKIGSQNLPANSSVLAKYNMDISRNLFYLGT